MLTKDFFTQVFPGRPYDPGQAYVHECAPIPPYVPPGSGGASGGGGCQVVPIYGSCAGSGGGPSESGGGQCIIGYSQSCLGGGGSGGGSGSVINPPSPPPPPPQTPTPVDAPKLGYAPHAIVTSIPNYADSYTKYLYFPGTPSNMRKVGSAFVADADYFYFYYLLSKASIQAAAANTGNVPMIFSMAIDTNQQGGQAPTATPYSPGNAPAGSLAMLAMNPLVPNSTVSQSSYSLYINNFAVPNMGAPRWPPPYPQGGVVDASNAGSCGAVPLYWPRQNGSIAEFDFSALGGSLLPSQSPPGVPYVASRQVYLSDPNTGQPLIHTDRDYVIAICATGFLGAKFARLKCGWTGP